MHTVVARKFRTIIQLQSMKICCQKKSPIVVRSRGHPRSKRKKKSKVDKVVKKLRMKKQEESTSTNGVQNQRGRKGNSHFDGYEAGSMGFLPNEFQELQTNQPAPPSHINSYIDLLQGKEDITEVLSPNMNE